MRLINILRNLKITKKLIILLFFPFLGIVYLSHENLMEKYAIVQESEKLNKTVELSTMLGAFIHEIQKERGISSAYLTSQGKQLSSELDNQRELTDRRIKELEAFLDQFDSAIHGESFSQQLTESHALLGEIVQMRSQIRSLSIDTSDMIEQFNALIDGYLQTIGIITNISSNNEITKLLNSYVNFLYAKEGAGIERALMSEVFARDSFKEGQFGEFIGLIVSQEAYIRSFRITANDLWLEEYEFTVEGDQIDAVSEMRDIARQKRLAGGFEVDVAVWSEMMTDKINLLKIMEDIQEDSLREHIQEILAQAKANFAFFLGMLIVTLSLMITMAWYISLNIVSRVHKINRVMTQIRESRNMTLGISDGSEDEIGSIAQSFDDLTSDTRAVISDIKDNSRQNADISSQLFGTSEEIRKSISVEGKTLTDKAIELGERLGHALHTSVSQSLNTRDEIQQAVKDLKEAKTQILQLVDDISANAESEQELARQIESLNRDAEQVKGVLTVIAEIADQTNLLALNAAIEAARAGEHGRGFAVVSDEVRKLAERTQKSLTEINTTVNMIVQGVMDASTRMNENANKIQALSEISGVVEHKIISTQEIVNRAGAASGDSARNAEELSSDAEEMIVHTKAMSDMMYTISETMNEISGAANQLKDMTDTLDHKIGRFEV